MPLTLQVGESKTAVVTVLDQNGQPISNFDFGANVPSWTIDQPSNVGLGPQSGHTEGVTGLAATTTPANLSVSVPGVVNPTATEQITVVAAPPPPPVPTSVQITFQ